MIEVRLRELRASDVPALRALADDPDTVAWNAVAWNAVGGEDLEGWITGQNEVADDFRTWAVASTQDDRFLGTVSAFHIDRERGVAELGYRVVPADRGRVPARGHPAPVLRVRRRRAARRAPARQASDGQLTR